MNPSWLAHETSLFHLRKVVAEYSVNLAWVQPRRCFVSYMLPFNSLLSNAMQLKWGFLNCHSSQMSICSDMWECELGRPWTSRSYRQLILTISLKGWLSLSSSKITANAQVRPWSHFLPSRTQRPGTGSFHGSWTLWVWPLKSISNSQVNNFHFPLRHIKIHVNASIYPISKQGQHSCYCWLVFKKR